MRRRESDPGMMRSTLWMMCALALPAMIVACCACSAGAEALLIDFNSTTQDNGPHPQVGYESYDAGHEVAGDFVPVGYSAFGTTVTLTPNLARHNCQYRHADD